MAEEKTDFEMHLRTKIMESGVALAGKEYLYDLSTGDGQSKGFLAGDFPVVQRLLEKRQKKNIEALEKSLFEFPEEHFDVWENDFHAFRDPNDPECQDYFNRWCLREIRKEFSDPSTRNKERHDPEPFMMRPDNMNEEFRRREEHAGGMGLRARLPIKKTHFLKENLLRKTSGQKRTRKANKRRCECCGKEIFRHNCPHTFCVKPCEYEEKYKLYKEKYKSNYPRIHRMRMMEKAHEYQS